MRPLSPRTAEIIALLRRQPTFRERVLGGRSDEALLLELGATPEPAVVPHLLPLALGVDAASRAAALTLHRILRAATGLGKWDRLALLLDAASAADAEVRDDAAQRLRAWLSRANRSFVQPSRSQVDELAASLGRVRPVLDPALHQELAAIVGDWSRRLSGRR